jgi:lipopolysaccharide assembly outer membrane protein LptD (OstA)
MICRRRLASLGLAAVLAATAGSAALAAGPPPPAPAGPTPGPVAAPPGGLQTPDYRIQTDETHWNFNSGDFTMPHRVHFLRPGTDAVGDKANGNSKKGTATLIGNVVVHDSGNATETGDPAYRGSGPATLTCDQLDIDSKSKLYTATGHVHFTQGARAGSADKAILNRGTGKLHLEGGVHLTDNGSTLTAASVDYDLNSKDAEVNGSPAVMTQPVSPPPAPAPAPTKPPKRKPPAKSVPKSVKTAKPTPAPSHAP